MKSHKKRIALQKKEKLNEESDIKEFSDNEEYNYEIVTSQENYKQHDLAIKNNITARNKSPSPLREKDIASSSRSFQASESNFNFDFQEKMAKKINEQAKRLTELQEYKILCEKRIRQLMPDHTLPIKESDLLNYDTPASDNTTSTKKIPIEDYKDLQIEKENLLETLRNETIANEEQRNYIEILRQTIESNIVKNGLGNMLQSIKAQYPAKQLVSNVDVIIDISKLKSDVECYRKELVMAKVLISELKQEIDLLKKTNEDVTILKDRIKENLDKGLVELDFATTRVHSLEQEKEEMASQLVQMNMQLKNIKEEADESAALNRKYEKEIQENSKRLSELNTRIESQQMICSKMTEYKKTIEKLSEDFDKIAQEKIKLNVENQQMIEDIESHLQEEKRLRKIIEEKEDKYDKDKKGWTLENENLNRNLKKSERYCNDLTTAIKEKANEIKRLEDKLSDLEEVHTSLKVHKEDFEFKFEDYVKLSERKIESLERNMREAQGLIKELKNKNEDVVREKEDMAIEVSNCRRELDILDQELKGVLKEKEAKERSFNLLNEQYEKLYNEFQVAQDERNSLKVENDSMGKEMRYWRDKYDKDANMKLNEVSGLSREISLKGNKIEDLQKEIHQLNEEVDSRGTIIRNLEQSQKALTSDILELKMENEELRKEIDKQMNDIMREKEYNLELDNKNNALSIKLQELASDIDGIMEDKDKIENSHKKLLQEADTLKKIDKEGKMKNSTLKSAMNEVKAIALSIEGVLNTFLLRVKSSLDDSEFHKIYSSTFIDMINAIMPSNNAIDSLKSIESNLKVFCSEMERLTHNILSSISKERIIKEITNELEQLKRDQNTTEGHYNKILNELKSKRSENKKLKNELENLKIGIEKYLEENQMLNQDNKEKVVLLSKISFQIQALEERIIILVKENKFLESLLGRVTKTHQNGDMLGIVQDIIVINDSISQLEREKIKLEEQLNKPEDMQGEIYRKEKEKIIEFTADIDKRISEQKEQLKILEKEMKKTASNFERQRKEDENEKEYRNNQLEKELNDTKDELKKVKSYVKSTEQNNIKNNNNRNMNDENSLSSFDYPVIRNYQTRIVTNRMNTNKNKNNLPLDNCESMQFFNENDDQNKPENIESKQCSFSPNPRSGVTYEDFQSRRK